MILAVSVLLAVLVGLLRRGSLRSLAQLPLRFGWVAVLAFGLQVYLIYFPDPVGQGLLSLHVLILVTSYLLLLWFIWQNRRLPGMILFVAGLVANLSVMLLNGGFMPITREALVQVGHIRNVQAAASNARVVATKDVVLPHEATVFWWLSDIFVLPPPFPLPTVFSIGDLLIALGTFWLIQSAMVCSGAFERNSGRPEAISTIRQ